MPTPHRTPRPFARFAAALLVSAGLLAGSVMAPGSAGIARAQTLAAAETADDTTPSATLTLAPSEVVLDPAQDRYEFTVKVDNPGGVSLPAGSLDLTLQPQRLNSTDELNAQLTEDASGKSVHLTNADMGAVAADASRSTKLTVQRDDFPLTSSDEPGVYLLTAAFTPESESAEPITGRVPFVWRGAGAAQATSAAGQQEALTSPTAEASNVQLGLIIPLVLPSSVRTTPTPAQLDAAVPNFEALLDVAAEARATVAIDPRIIASIRAYGNEASAQSQDFLHRLENINTPSFLLQFADADPAAQAAIGLTTLLKPTNLEYLTRLGSFPDGDDDTSGGETTGSADAGDAAAAGTTADTDSAAGSDTAASGDEAAAASDADTGSTGSDSADSNNTDSIAGATPRLEQLLAWPHQADPVAWPAEGQVDGTTMSLLQASGITDVVLTSGNVTHEGGPVAALGDTNALVADDTIGDGMRRALAATDDTERLAAMSTVSARLAMTAQSANSGVLLALDRGAIADADDPAALIEQLFLPSWVEAAAVQSLPEGTTTLRAASTLEERRELLRSAAGREADVNEVSVLLQHPADLTGYQRARLLNLFATRYAAADADFAAVAEQYTERDDELRSGVQVVSAEHTQLVGTSTQVPLQLRNHLPFDAIVSASVFPISAALNVNEREFTDIVVTADGNARVMVPVRSRVSSGESGLSIEVTDRSGEFISDSGVLQLTLRASIEKIGFWVLGVLAALLLVFGTVRSIRRRARARALREQGAGAEAEASSGAIADGEPRAVTPDNAE